MRVATVTVSLVLVLVLLASLVPADATAGSERAYRWVDDNGVVHFSSQPPADEDVKEVRLTGEGPALAPAEDTDPLTAAPVVRDERSERCLGALQRVEAMSRSRAVGVSEPGQSTPRIVTGAELQEHLRRARLDVEIECGERASGEE